MEEILVTGGAGYIGSHTCVKLIEEGYRVIVADNLSNGNAESLKRAEEITGSDIPLFEVDLRDRRALEKLFSDYDIASVVHFAGYKAVGESVEKPLLYYSNNVSTTVTLLEVMQNHGTKNMVFSSTCTVYGKPENIPVDESAKLNPANPYGRSKLMVEKILRDNFNARPEMSVSVLRYFNPIGAHPSGIMGEDPSGIPDNLLPYVSRVAAGQLERLQIFGDDYDTEDGTGVRDYIHIMDLAGAHVEALAELEPHDRFFEIYNLGTGRGYSVLEVVKTFETVSGRKIPYEITDRRPGDIDKTYADPSKANEKLGWSADQDLEEMCKDMWHWQKKNPNGYQTERNA